MREVAAAALAEAKEAGRNRCVLHPMPQPLGPAGERRKRVGP
jgi:hypothetical protein